MNNVLRGNDLTNFVVKTSEYPIGTGGFTDVFRGTLNGQEQVALKIFKVSLQGVEQDADDIRRRIARESATWARLEHENVQPYLGFARLGPPPIQMALVTPYCASGALDKMNKDTSASDKFRLIQDVAKGLHYLHSKDIIHGDLKPNNVLVEGGRARLCDFGRSVVIGEQGYSTNLVAGSIAYMAPELLPSENLPEGQKLPFSKESDVYAFAMTIYMILTGEEPWGACLKYQIPASVRRGVRPSRKAGISDSMWSLLEDCWVTEFDRRPSTQQILQRLA